MFPRSNTAGSTSSTVSVAIGVILGAALTFCIQVYANHVQDERTARQSRAQHIERLMIAGKNAFTTATNSMFKLADIGAKMHGSGISAANFEKLTPDRAPVTELRAVSALYLPEVKPEADRMALAYDRFCQDLMVTYPLKMLNYKSGDSLQPDPKLTEELVDASLALETKLIELAKKNRQ
jgi:hypothetical protein